MKKTRSSDFITVMHTVTSLWFAASSDIP